MVVWLYGHAYQLERKLHGGGEGRGGGEEQEKETEKIQYQENITANSLYEDSLVLCQTSPLKGKRINPP